MNNMENYHNEINDALTVSSLGRNLNPNQTDRFLEELAKAGLCVMPIPEKQVHNVERLVEAEEIIAYQNQLLEMQATEIFTDSRRLVGKRNKAVLEYREKYGKEALIHDPS
jgi:phosphosulfolactate synthase (CoM biosynthesis protein A)